MRDGCVSCDCIDESNTYSLSKGTEVCVFVGGWPMTFTTSTAGVGTLATGENTIAACGAYVEDVTHTDMKGKKDE